MTPDGPAQPASRMPVLFVGHGSPVNAIEDNTWSRSLRALAAWLPKMSAILAVSAHWYVPGTFVTGNAHPRTIHDFSGFAYELFKIEYRAPGSLDLARRVVELLGDKAGISNDWGLDHGTWSVLVHLRPEADCPVVQVGLDVDLAPAQHLALGRTLAPLRDEKVLILASGNLTHNLRYAMTHALNDDLSTPEWAARVDAEVTRAIEQHDTDALVRVLDTDDGRMAHPTPEHYLPLLYAAGAASSGDIVRFPVTGFDMGSLSMRSVMFG
jgi:4,5-DOPA dioxygenase extradiol